MLGILGFTAAFGGCTIGIREGLASIWVGPACVDACRAAGATFEAVDYHLGKTDNQSFCVCTNHVRLPSARANTAASFSVLGPIGVTLGGMIVVALVVARRQRRAR